MPKIPTFESQARPTAEVGAVKASFQVPLTNDLFSKAQTALTDYYVKEKEEEAKLKSIDYQNKALPKLYEVYDKYKNNPFPSEAADGFNKEATEVINNFINENLSNENKFVQRAVSTKLGANLTQLNLATIKSSRDAMEKNAERVDKDWDSGLVSKMGTIPGFIESGQAYNESAEYVNNKYMGDPYTKKIKLDEKFKIIDTFAMVQDSKNPISFLQKVKENPELYKNADLNLKSQLILQAQEQSKKVADGTMIYENFNKGIDVLTGTNSDNKETLENIEQIATQKVYSPEKTSGQIFAEVDNTFKGVGRVAPTYQSILKNGVNTALVEKKITPTALRAIDIADAAEQTGRLDEYTTDKEYKFYRNVLTLKRIKGYTSEQAFSTAVDVQSKYLKITSLPSYERKRDSSLIQIKNAFSSIKTTNSSDILSYGESLFDIYITSGFSPDEAQKQTLIDLKKDIVVIDKFAYLKRDIHPFKSIDGLENIIPTKEFIIKKYIPDEDPKDYYLKHSGAGTFDIYNRSVLHPVYSDDGKRLSFTFAEMKLINNERKELSKKQKSKEVISIQEKTQEKLLKQQEPQLIP